MKLYVGLDVGLEETSVCIVDSEGLTIREVKVNTEPEAIRSALEDYADRLDHRWVSGCIANYRQPGFQSLSWKHAICAFRYRRCATKLTETMRAASRR